MSGRYLCRAILPDGEPSSEERAFAGELAITNPPRVCIRTQSVYIEAQLSSDNERYVFAYIATICNLGRAPVQLLGRYWLITSGNDREIEVQSEGVVGAQSPITPGEEYQYTSGAIIGTPPDTVQGHYETIDENDVPFNIDIPVSRLVVPTLIH